MHKLNRFLLFFIVLFHGILIGIPTAFAQIKIVAAENFYGEVAKELGGDHVIVTSILQNPEQDPHLFTASPSAAKAIAEADIVVYNGADYDDWMPHLLSVSHKRTPRVVVQVAELIRAKKGENPHIWYIPTTLSRYAETLSEHLATLDPTHKNDYAERLIQFQREQTTLQNTVTRLREKLKGTPVTATEPVFNWMAEALGLQMRHLDFQWSIENEGSPSPAMIKAMLDDLKNKKVSILFYNAQVRSPLTDRMKAAAEQSAIPVIGVTETQPVGTTYHQWMMQQLQSIERVL